MEAAENLIRVCVVGAAGNMGREVLKRLTKAEGFEIVSAVDHRHEGESCKDMFGRAAPDVTIRARAGQAMDDVPTDVLVDFSQHGAAVSHALSAISRGVRPVLGTVGISAHDLRDIKAKAAERKLGGLYAPTFSLAYVLLMRFCEMASRHIPNVEIVEMHQDRKRDTPSHMALLTAEMIAHGRRENPNPKPPLPQVESAPSVRVHDVGIHSVRLPGLTAHQIVIFGAPGEALTIRADLLDRGAIVEGVKLGVREVMKIDHFVCGLEHFIDKV